MLSSLPWCVLRETTRELRGRRIGAMRRRRQQLASKRLGSRGGRGVRRFRGKREEQRRSRRMYAVAQRPRQLSATTVEAQWRVVWRCGASAEAAAARCYVMKRRPKRLAFERDGIDDICCRGTPRHVSSPEKELGVCRRKRRSKHGGDRRQRTRSSPRSWRHR